MIQENEVINLLMGLAAIPALWALSHYGRLPRLPLLYVGFGAMMGVYVFTILEGFVWGDVFNALEHACLAAAGFFFFLGFRRLDLTSRRGGSAP